MARGRGRRAPRPARKRRLALSSMAMVGAPCETNTLGMDSDMRADSAGKIERALFGAAENETIG